MDARTLIPVKLRPYAKALVAVTLSVIPAVSTVAFTSAPIATKLIIVVTAAAIPLGVLAQPNSRKS